METNHDTPTPLVVANYTDVRYLRPQILLLTNLWCSRTPSAPTATQRGVSRRRTEVAMASTDNLARRIASAQERLNAARRDGRCEDIMTWRKRVDELLDEYPKTPQPRENA